MAYTSLEDLMRYLSPGAFGRNPHNPSPTPTKKRTTADVVMECCLDHQRLLSCDAIKTEIEGHFTRPTADEEVQKGPPRFHGITLDGPINASADDYFDTNTKIGDIVPDINSISNLESFKCAVMSINDPFVNPSLRATSYIDFFLNHTPPLVASQMVPYLDVEFQQMNRPKTGGLGTPSIMKFLLGAKDQSMLNANDRALLELPGAQDGKELMAARTGMELFLMPQTLTDMDNLGDLGARFARPKPFVPFASVEGFDVTIQNAGALTYAHKKGTLRLKVHDKSRIGEIAEFIKGPVGFRQSLVWTTYGWIAPTGRGPDDEYLKFINDNMVVRDCWDVINSQFGMDASGQLTVTLTMMSHAAKVLQGLDVTLGSSDEAVSHRRKLESLRLAMEEVGKIRTELEGDKRFSVDVLANQVLHAASTNGSLDDVKNARGVDDAIKQTIAAAKKSSIDRDRIATLESQLRLVQTGNKSANGQLRAAVKKKFDNLGNGPDPFLVTRNGKASKHWTDKSKVDLEVAIKEVNSTHEAAAAAQTQRQSTTQGDDVGITKVSTPVVSCGKLFMNFIIPGPAPAAANKKFKELQVFFYNLNDNCGPISGRSIAEFPIDTLKLANAYEKKLKDLRLDALTLETFTSLVRETQFADLRSVGYGMYKEYKPFDPAKPGEAVINDSKKAKNAHDKWIETYGVFVPPQLEIYVESSNDINKSGAVAERLKSGEVSKEANDNIVVRIHIYDKAHTSHDFATQVCSSGDIYAVGLVDKGSVERSAAAIQQKIANDKTLLERLKKASESKSDEQLKTALQEAGASDLVEKIMAGKNQVAVVGKNRTALKEYLKSIVPNVTIGSNGSMVSSINLSSKTEGLQDTLNLQSSLKGTAAGNTTMINNGLEEVGGLPLRSVPAQLTMTTMGVPIAQLYQEYFVDFDTGTTLDNMYRCNTITHNMSPGKFVTNWSFIYGNGYAKFSSSAPTELMVATRQIVDILDAAAKSQPKPRKNARSGR